MPAQPLPAATVILLREGADGLETYLLRRAATMAFAPLMHVFPGGRVDRQDHVADVRLLGADVEHLAHRGSTDPAGIASLYACAVRETAEETGVVLAATGDGGTLVIDVTRLPIIDHWVTPDTESHRYDVRFFIAALPQGQEARLATTEADVAMWVTPAFALREFALGRLALLPPTEATLRHIAGFTTLEEVLRDAARRPIVPLLPRRIVDETGGRRWIMVNDRTGEVLADPIEAPHTRETDGVRRRDPWAEVPP